MKNITILRYLNKEIIFYYYINNKKIERRNIKIFDLLLEEIDYLLLHCSEEIIYYKNEEEAAFQQSHTDFYERIIYDLDKELLNRRVDKIVKLKKCIYDRRSICK